MIEKPRGDSSQHKPAVRHFNVHHIVMILLKFRLMHDDLGAAFDGVFNKAVSVGGKPENRHKQRAGHSGSRIVNHIADLNIDTAVFNFDYFRLFD